MFNKEKKSSFFRVKSLKEISKRIVRKGYMERQKSYHNHVYVFIFQ